MLNLALICEILANDSSSIATEDEQRLITDSRQPLMTAIESILKRFTLDLIKRTQKELGQITFYISRKGEPKKSERIVNSWDLETVIEYSMASCYKCDRNHKACRLKVAYKKLNIPVMDEGQQGCPYRIEKE